MPICDRRYRGHGLKGETKIHLVGKIPRRATKSLRKWVKQGAAVGPIIGHLYPKGISFVEAEGETFPLYSALKSDYRLNRNPLKGKAGDHAHVVLVAAAYNMAKLLAWFYCACDLKACYQRFILKSPFDLNKNLTLSA